MASDYAVGHDGGTLLRVEASPGSARSGIDGVNPWRRAVRVKVRAEARNGKANDELIDVVAEALSIPRKGIDIVKGSRSHLKTVLVPLPVDEVISRLGMD